MQRRLKKLLGNYVDTFCFEDAICYANGLLDENKGGIIVTINPEMIEITRDDQEFKEIINNAELIIPDGIGVKIAMRIKGHNIDRIAGIEFAHKLLGICAENNYSVGLLGAKKEIIEKASKNLKEEMKDIDISFTQDGYFKDEEKVISILEKSQPRLLLVAMGAPRQEKFIKKALEKLPNTLMIGVGGSFDVWSGEVKRAPKIYQRLGLEWLYRTIKQPERCKRIFPNLPKFIFRVLLEG